MATATREITATQELLAPNSGMIRIEVYATSYGTVKINEKVEGVYQSFDDFTWTEQVKKVVTMRPFGTYQLEITGGTGVVVTVTDMTIHTA